MTSDDGSMEQPPHSTQSQQLPMEADGSRLKGDAWTRKHRTGGVCLSRKHINSSERTTHTTT